MRDGTWLDARRMHIERLTVSVEFGGPFSGEFAQGKACFDRAANRFVVDVGNITHVLHLNTVGFNDSTQYVLY
jgi:hypothetical protein